MHILRRLLPACLMIALVSTAGAQVSAYRFSTVQGTYTSIVPDSVVADSTDDFVAFNRSIGFPFLYGGVRFTKFAVNSNGFISLGRSFSSDLVGASYVDRDNPSGAALYGIGSDYVVAGFNMNLASRRYSRLSYAVVGTAPNRSLVVEWQNFCLYQEPTDSLNFQIRLQEGSNSIRVVYGRCVYHSTEAFEAQVGLRGASAADFNSRTSASGWANAATSTQNDQGIRVTPQHVPPTGLSFTWSPNPDVAIVSASLPRVLCSYGTSEALTVRFRNAGAVPVDTVEAQYSINRSAPVQQRWAVRMNPGDTLSRTFDRPLDLTDSVTYRIYVSTRTRGEVNTAANDLFTLQFGNQAPRTALPYLEGFDSTRALPPGWSVLHVAGFGDWSMTGPQVPYGTQGSSATSIRTVQGRGAVFFNSFQRSFDGGLSRLNMPCFDFSRTTDSLMLELGYLQSGTFTNGQDSLQVQVSTDGGSTYARLATFFRLDENLTGATWTRGLVDISRYAGLASVRFAFLAGGANGDNLAIDYVGIRSLRVTGASLVGPKVGVVAYPNPTSGRFSLRGLPVHLIGQGAVLLDASGRRLRTLALAPELSLEGVPPGLYILAAQDMHLPVLRAD